MQEEDNVNLFAGVSATAVDDAPQESFDTPAGRSLLLECV